MPTPTYELLASVDLTSTSSSITLSNIPQTSSHLFLTIMPNISSDRPYITVNSVTSNYRWMWFTGSAGGSVSSSAFNQSQIQGSQSNSGNYRGGHQLMMTNYSSTKEKAFSYMGQAGDNETAWVSGGTIPITEAITSITIASASASYTSGTKISLWGVLI